MKIDATAEIVDIFGREIVPELLDAIDGLIESPLVCATGDEPEMVALGDAVAKAKRVYEFKHHGLEE